MARECPRCGLVNPPRAQRCARGYDLTSGQVFGSPPAAHDRGGHGSSAGTWFALGCFGVVLGAALGVLVAVPMRLQAASQAAETVREHEGHVCGLIVRPVLAEGVFLGTLVGGLAGFVASVLLGRLARRRRSRAEPAAAADGGRDAAP
jgi:hypothetical protein